MDVLFESGRCPVCGAEGYVDDDGIVRCSNCLAEIVGDDFDWGEDVDFDNLVAVDPEDFLAHDQRGPRLSERARRRDALVHREEIVTDRERRDEPMSDEDDSMLPDYAGDDQSVETGTIDIGNTDTESIDSGLEFRPDDDLYL